MKKIALLTLLAAILTASPLQLKNGSVTAHTEMVMDKTIDPKNSSLKGDLTMDGGDITTMRGKFYIEASLFKSDNAKRDDHMHQEMEVGKFKLATYTIQSIVKNGSDYTINGKLNFHGVEKDLSAKAKVKNDNGTILLDASSSFLMSDFGIKPPCMVFMCVRDKLDLTVNAQLLESK